jgi:hypothetical protein
MIDVIRRSFGKQNDERNSAKIIQYASKVVLKYGSENLILEQRSRQRLAAAQVKFLRVLLRLTTLDIIRST